MGWGGIKSIIQKDMAMDLGTANTLIYVRGKGIVLSQPSIIARSTQDGQIFAVGDEARRYWGKTPKAIEAVRPLKDGVIADFDATKALVQVLLAKAQQKSSKGLLTPRIVIGVPSLITQVEKKAVLDATKEAGAKKVFLIEETMAAAIGAGLDISKEEPNMIVDIGGGTTEIAVISNFSFIACHSLAVAGDEMDEAIARFLKEKYNIEIGLTMAEEIKWQVGAATKETAQFLAPQEIRGKDLVKGIPTTTLLDPCELYPVFEDILKEIVKGISKLYDSLDTDIKSIIEHKGILLTGGGALLKGIVEYFENKLGLRIKLAPDPLTTVVTGAGKVTENLKDYKKLFVN